jgi:hypothetical protein
MDQSLLETAPYDPATASRLESYVSHQLSSRVYDFNANKALLKNYQVNIHNAKVDVICTILVLSLMQLPKNDFHSLSYLIPTRIAEETSIVLLKQTEALLTQGKFSEFWEEYVSATQLFDVAIGFVDNIRLYILSTLRNTYRTISKSLFSQYLGVDESSIEKFCHGNQFIERISEDSVIFAANGENGGITRSHEETFRPEQVSAINSTIIIIIILIVYYYTIGIQNSQCFIHSLISILFH